MGNILNQEELDRLTCAMDYKSANISQEEYDETMTTSSDLIDVYRKILINDIDKQLKSKVTMISTGYEILISVTKALTLEYANAMEKAIEIKNN